MRVDFTKLLDDFQSDYQHYCMRVYNYRETLRRFVCEFSDIQFTGDQEKFLKDSFIRSEKIDIVFRKFRTSDLKIIINDRNLFTHDIDPSLKIKTTESLSTNRKKKKERVVSSIVKNNFTYR